MASWQVGLRRLQSDFENCRDNERIDCWLIESFRKSPFRDLPFSEKNSVGGMVAHGRIAVLSSPDGASQQVNIAQLLMFFDANQRTQKSVTAFAAYKKIAKEAGALLQESPEQIASLVPNARGRTEGFAATSPDALWTMALFDLAEQPQNCAIATKLTTKKSAIVVDQEAGYNVNMFFVLPDFPVQMNEGFPFAQFFPNGIDQCYEHLEDVCRSSVLAIDLLLNAASAIGAESQTTESSTTKAKVIPKKRGRKPDTDAKDDCRIFEAWKTGSYKTLADLAKSLNKTKRQVEQAIDRHRKRLRTRRKNTHH